MRHQAAAQHVEHPLNFHLQRRWAARLGHRWYRHLFDRFLLLPLGAAIALIWANSAPESYFSFTQRISFPVNEIGMAFFFALMTQEVVEAAMPGGALHSWRRWGLPIVAAAGGIIGSVSVYLAFVNASYQSVLSLGWPVACAIDVAAAYYVLKAILPRSGALPFVLLIGIATNAFGMFVVAPRHLVLATHVGGAVLMLIAIGLAGVMRAIGIRAFVPYLAICGTISWFAFFWSGLHPAFALVPIVPFLPHEPRRLDLFADPPDDDATHHFEHEWNALVQGILFLFGLVNAGVMLRGYGTGSWAVLAAALVGRPAGILAAVGLAVLAGLHLPRRLGWRELVVVALASSSGFTIALFFATAVVAIGPLLAQITLGALATGVGALLALGAARLLHIGRFARRSAEKEGVHGFQPESR
jgi:NhaA family Na+:H+ antiporter